MTKLHYGNSPIDAEKKAFAGVLAEDEELVLATGFGKAYLRSRFIVGLLWPGIIPWGAGIALAYFLKFNLEYGVLLGLILSGIMSYLRTTHLYHANRYLLTTRRVIIKKGIFAVKLTSALFDKVTHIEVDQSFFDKVFMHHGTIIINTAGMSKDEIVIGYVDYPMEFKNLLERLINREREQFGMKATPIVTVEGEVV